jgi:hypothetical protein
MTWFSDNRDFNRAQWQVLPKWVKTYVVVVGLPSILFLAFHFFESSNPLSLSLADKVAVALFTSAVAINGGALFRAFWRMDV